VKTVKPKCKLVGKDGNIFNLMGIASKALKEAGLKEKADEMVQRIMSSKSYDEALGIIMEYVDVE
jgi:hypothetical protein